MKNNNETTAAPVAPYNYFEDIDALVGTIPADSIVSRTILKRDGTHIIIFGFAPGQELSEHTSARAAILHIVRGNARLTLGTDTMRGVPGTLAYMQPNLPHSVNAESETIMVLIMLERHSA